MKNDRARSKLPTRQQREMAYAGMHHLIDVLFRVRKDAGQWWMRELMKHSIYQAIVKDNKQVWCNFNKVFGPFIITTTRSRGPRKKTELTEWVRQEVAHHGRRVIPKIADEKHLEPRSIEYHLYPRKKRT